MGTPALSALLSELLNVPIAPRPVNETWKEMITRIKVPGRLAEIDRDTYWYFLEILPPHHQFAEGFAFVEGMDALRLFFCRAGVYLVRQLTWEETVTFCQAAGIHTPIC